MSTPLPDLRESVLAAIAPRTPKPLPGLRQRLAALIWTPRQVAIRPAWALAAVCVAVVAALYAPRALKGTAFPGDAASPQIFVEFRLNAEAASVQLAGSFTNWQPLYDLHQVAPNQWLVTVPLTQGVHDYAFVLDGTRWVADPYAASVDDGFGGTNSRVTLLSSDIPKT